jgi:integrase
VPKPRARVMTPDEIERLRVAMPTLRDRALLGLLAYAGPRPEEALALRWVDVGRLLVIDRALAGTKTNHRRTVEIIKPLAADLEELRARSVGEGLVAPSETGAHGRLGHWRNRVWTRLRRNWRPRRRWRRRSSPPACEPEGQNRLRESCAVEVLEPSDLSPATAESELMQGESEARAAGFEPATSGSGGQRSIH